MRSQNSDAAMSCSGVPRPTSRLLPGHRERRGGGRGGTVDTSPRPSCGAGAPLRLTERMA